MHLPLEDIVIANRFGYVADRLNRNRKTDPDVEKTTSNIIRQMLIDSLVKTAESKTGLTHGMIVTDEEATLLKLMHGDDIEVSDVSVL